MTVVLTIKEIKPWEANDQITEAILDWHEVSHNAYYPEDEQTPRDVRRKNMKVVPLKEQVSFHFYAFEGEKIIGVGYFGYRIREQETNPDFCGMDVTVHPEYLQQGIGTQLLAKLKPLAKEHNKSKVNTWIKPDVNNGDGLKFAEKHGLKFIQLEKKNRLYRDSMNREFIDDSFKKLNDSLSKYEFKLFEKKDFVEFAKNNPEMIDELADYWTETGNLVPRGDSEQVDHTTSPQDLRKSYLKYEEYQWNEITYMAFDGKKIIGNSSLYYPGLEGRKQYNTGLTATRKAYQRQGIATYMKILAIKEVERRGFAYIDTENAEENAGMLAINTNLGFKLASTYHSYEGKVKFED